MSKEELIKQLEQLKIPLTSDIIQKLDQYADFLLEYNQHTNLTAIKTIEEVYLKHFYDSLTLIKISTFADQKLLDIGTGAGFPGLVLAIVFPNLQVSLLDSNNKKTTFLNKCIEKLKLNNVEVYHSRAEEFVKNNREKYDFITSRAVAELRILLELSIPALKIGGFFLAMKGNVEEELSKSQKTFKILSSEISQKEEFELPNNGGHRTLLKIKKLSSTSLKYPRLYDQIKKKEIA